MEGSWTWLGHSPWLPHLPPQLVAIDGELCPGASGPRLPACAVFSVGLDPGCRGGEMGAGPRELLPDDLSETLSRVGFLGDKAGLCTSDKQNLGSGS